LPRTSPFAGGIPVGTATAEPITLTSSRRSRALEHNLGLLLAEQDTASAKPIAGRAQPAVAERHGSITSRGARPTSRRSAFRSARRFPKWSVRSTCSTRAFSRRSRSSISTRRTNRARRAPARRGAAHYRGAREIVLLASANLYLEALAAEARSLAAQAQLASSSALHQQAIDLKQSGIIAGLDVVRAEVRVSADRQRATAAANDAQKAKLQLARLIGLPIGQEFMLVDNIPLVPDPPMSLQQALDQAYARRADYQAALEEQRAAEDSRQAAVGGHLPSVRVTADYGAIGLTPGSALPTFNVTGAVDVPIFQGGRQKGRLAQADAELKRRSAVVEDLKASVYYDVRTGVPRS
jgi:outer membrane protein TolC